MVSTSYTLGGVDILAFAVNGNRVEVKAEVSGCF